MKKTINRYIDFPKVTKKLFPIIFLEHLLTVFVLNIPAYFKIVGLLNYHIIGELISSYYFGCLLGAIFGAFLSLNFHLKNITSIGMIAAGFDFYLLFNTTDNYLILIYIFLIGILGTIVITSNFALLIRSVKDQKVKLQLIGIDLILFNIAFSLVNFIIMDMKPLNTIFVIHYFPFVIMLTGFLFLLFYRKQTSICKTKKFTLRKFFPTQKYEFVILMMMVCCFGLIFSMVKVVFAPVLLDRYGSNAISATLASVNPWIIFLFQPQILNCMRNSNSKLCLGLGCFIVGFSYFLFGITSSSILAVSSLVLLTIGEMLFGPLSKHLNMQLYGAGKEGVAAGMWKASFLSGGILGPKLSGYLAVNHGVDKVWMTCGLIGVISFLLSHLLKIRCN